MSDEVEGFAAYTAVCAERDRALNVLAFVTSERDELLAICTELAEAADRAEAQRDEALALVRELIDCHSGRFGKRWCWPTQKEKFNVWLDRARTLLNEAD